MNEYRPIECAAYDWLEIACMDRYEVELDLGSERAIGVAQDLKVCDGAEYLQLSLADSRLRDVRIDGIRSIRVLTRPARFAFHAFDPDLQ